ncbi:hypothetical protein IC757_08945 [Wenzhouxiangella sp. AB-CW3]|uniref:hypothetical protein n=1 Tax=Wenzhouxiangella sp. AB-CW3 TaxID=2771012 RepID=UPI00168B32E7|nr:hypothetical protein [Wenzhouxiangella sp. AB-CW3]QOC21181.1 hypothetical protein IC757_08945 [Wenzhouxiangella sp. AB-CW3]
MMNTHSGLTGASRALQEYLEQLLGGDRPAKRNGVEASSEPLLAPAPEMAAEELTSDLYYRFVAAGLTLAIPAGRISCEMALPEIMTPPLAPHWRRVAETDSGPLIVVDTRTLVLPPGQADPGLRLANDSHHLVVLDDGDWALVAESEGIEEELDLDDVSWRSTAGKRIWLAGTVASRRMALLDLDEIRRLVR